MSSTPPNRPTGISDSWVDLSSSASGPHSPLRVTPVPFGGETDYLRMLQEAQRESTRSSAKVSPISSALMSLNSTTRNTPSMSPKSPPNSPNPELASFEEELRNVYINRCASAADAPHSPPVMVHGSAAAVSSSSLLGPSGIAMIGTSSSSSNLDPADVALSASDIIWDWSSKPGGPPKVFCRRFCGGGSKYAGNRLAAVLDECEEEEEEESRQKEQDKGSRKGIFSRRFLYTVLITNLVSLLIGAGIGVWLCKKGSSVGDAMVEIGI